MALSRQRTPGVTLRTPENGWKQFMLWKIMKEILIHACERPPSLTTLVPSWLLLTTFKKLKLSSTFTTIVLTSMRSPMRSVWPSMNTNVVSRFPDWNALQCALGWPGTSRLIDFFLLIYTCNFPVWAPDTVSLFCINLPVASFVGEISLTFSALWITESWAVIRIWAARNNMTSQLCRKLGVEPDLWVPRASKPWQKLSVKSVNPEETFKPCFLLSLSYLLPHLTWCQRSHVGVVVVFSFVLIRRRNLFSAYHITTNGVTLPFPNHWKLKELDNGLTRSFTDSSRPAVDHLQYCYQSFGFSAKLLFSFLSFKENKKLLLSDILTYWKIPEG